MRGLAGQDLFRLSKPPDAAAPAGPPFEIEDSCHGRSEEEDLQVAPRHAPRPSRHQPGAYVESKDSGELVRPHHVDLKTGMYRGRQVLDIKRPR